MHTFPSRSLGHSQSAKFAGAHPLGESAAAAPQRHSRTDTRALTNSAIPGRHSRIWLLGISSFRRRRPSSSSNAACGAAAKALSLSAQNTLTQQRRHAPSHTSTGSRESRGEVCIRNKGSAARTGLAAAQSERGLLL
ncbi:hypothetical protein MTO96_022777 [Rhipicephalus appendiculatus]